jgi:hypothetical protein
MKIKTINTPIKCDTVLCNHDAIVSLETNSYKGNTYLCEHCFKELQNLIKRNASKNETKE